MDKKLIKKVGFLLLGAGIGGTIGYFAGKALAQYIEDREYEANLPEATFNGVIEEEDDEDENSEVLPDEKSISSIKTDVKIPPVNYNAMSHKKLDELASKYKTPEPDEMASVYIITKEQYDNSKPGWVTETITYYEDDTTFSDSGDEIVTDPVKMLGPNCQLHFGEGSEDPDIVYVRNDNERVDYEVIRQKGSYHVIVLGEPEEEKKITRKERKTKKVDTLKDEREDEHEQDDE